MWLKNNPNADETLPEINLTGRQLFFLNFAQVRIFFILPNNIKGKFRYGVVNKEKIQSKAGSKSPCTLQEYLGMTFN